MELEMERTANAPALDVNDPALAATLEVHYLRPLLEAMPPQWKNAVDVGAHRGDVTEALTNWGFRVLAVEPQKQMADRLEQRLGAAIGSGALSVARCAASDHQGEGQLLVGRSTIVSTLEADWTTAAFPEEFSSAKRVTVPLRRVADLVESASLGPIGFAKVDAQGHELPVLKGLLADDRGASPPAVVMFEAHHAFPQRAIACLALLRSHGYETFDVFVREGTVPVAAERFDGAGLPAAWGRCGGRPFYANVIAYHSARPVGSMLPDLAGFVETYRVAAARDVLRRALRREAQWPAPMNSERARARRELREFLLSRDDWSAFLQHPACKHLFGRGRWGAAQDFERAALGGSALGRRLVVTTAEPSVGSPQPSEVLPALSTAMLGAAYTLHRVHQQCGGRLPATVVEVGGGYGAFAWLYARQVPTAAYAIVDLAEMLAVQHYFLSHALPERRVRFVDEADFLPQAGEITLLPAALLTEAAPAGELLLSNFAYAEMSADLRATIARREYFGARHLFLTGTLAGDPAGVGQVDPSEVVGPVMRSFPKVVVERLHVGENYLVMADR